MHDGIQGFLGSRSCKGLGFIVIQECLPVSYSKLVLDPLTILQDVVQPYQTKNKLLSYKQAKAWKITNTLQTLI